MASSIQQVAKDIMPYLAAPACILASHFLRPKEDRSVAFGELNAVMSAFGYVAPSVGFAYATFSVSCTAFDAVRKWLVKSCE